jgi:RNA polymerase sigma-70 factor, ECF subfamily
MSAVPALEATIDLLHRAREGDESAWDLLVGRHRRSLKLLAHRRLPSHARSMTDTEDVVQDAFTRALKFVHSRDFSSHGAFLAYLRRVVINRILDELRRSARTPPLSALPEDCATPARSPLELAIGNERAARYRHALGQLRQRDRELVELRLEEGLAYQEIAARLGFRTADASRVATGRAIWRLSRQLSAKVTPPSVGGGHASR